MNNFFKTSLSALMITVTIAAISTSCKKNFDAPPAYAAANLTATTTIRELKAMHTNSNNTELIADDLIIRGIVIADDKSGNYYKSIVLQDATGGILIRLEGTSLYTSFPIGMEVFVKCNGLYLGDYNRLVQLGGAVDNTGTFPSILTIPAALFSKYLVKGSIGNVVTPRVVTPDMLSTNMQDTFQNTLIKLNNYEFDRLDTGKTYATATPPTSINFVLKNCSGASSSITLRNSGFANFAALNVPNGNGSIVSVYTVFGNTKQLTIRDTSDLQFYGTRCNGSGGGGGGNGNGTLTPLSSIRSLYTGSDILLPAAYKVTGIVISDAANKNINKSTVIIQDGNSGISIYFGSTATVAYNIGDSVVIDVTGDSLLKFRGSLQIKGNASQLSAAVAIGKTVATNVVTITQLNTAMALPLGTGNHIENTLVKIVNATASGSPATFGGNKTLTDATGNIVLRTSTTASGPATFAATALPGGQKNWTGYCSFFNTTAQFQIRNPALDIQ